MNSFFRSSLFSAALAGGLTAQTAPKPAAPAHDHAPVALDQFVTSATPFKRNQVDLAQSTSVLAGRSLLLKQQPTLGATLGGETGISESYYGPGSSRPIVRGLDGERVRILENGLALLDASANSPDHAVAVEPFLVDRIEAVRGPAALLYGNAAVGGVVNVEKNRQVMKRAHVIKVGDVLIDEDGEKQVVSKIILEESKTPRTVINLSVPGDNRVNGIIVANGLQVGDNNWQKILDERYQREKLRTKSDLSYLEKIIAEQR